MLIIFIRLYIISLVLIYLTAAVYPFWPPSSIPPPNLLPPVVTSLVFFLSVTEFVCFWSTTDTRHYIQLLVHSVVVNISIHFKIITTVKSSCHLSPYKILHLLLNRIPHCTFFISVTHLFCNWKLVPSNLPHLFPHSPSHTHLETTCVFSASMTVPVCNYIVHKLCFFRFHV